MTKFILAENPDYEIITAKNGFKALEIAKSKSPDLIVMDWDMPYMDGLETTKQLKADPKTRLIPVIIVTVHNSPERLRQAIESGADDFVSNLTSSIELNTRITSVLRTNQLYLNEVKINEAIVRQNQIIEEKNEENNKIKRIVYTIFLTYSIIALVSSFVSFEYFRVLSHQEKKDESISHLVFDIQRLVVMGQQLLTRRLTKPDIEFQLDLTYYKQFEAIESKLDTMSHKANQSVEEKHLIDLLSHKVMDVNTQIHHEIATYTPKSFPDMRELNAEIGALFQAINKLRNYYAKKRESTFDFIRTLNVVLVTITVIVTIFLAVSIQFFIKEDSKESWWFRFFFRT